MKKNIFITFLSFFCFLLHAKAQTAANAATPVAVVDTLLFKPYVGNYKSDMGAIKVWIENGQLLGELEGSESAELRLTEKPDVLTVVGMDGSVTFTRNDAQKVVKVTIAVQGQNIVGERVE